MALRILLPTPQCSRLAIVKNTLGCFQQTFSGMATNGNVVEGSPPAPKKSKVAIEQIYQKKTQLEHILLRPDTYIGSVEPVTEQMWVFEDEKMVQKNITYVPGLYKIFDEILVNAADNKQRDKNMDLIKIDIDQENNEISIWNNGTGIPVVEHKGEKMFVPTMIFGHLLTSSNFNDDEKKVTGGRNGYGAKLCNVFSTKFIVETAHKKSKKKFKQVWEKNMLKTTEPKIKESAGEDYTRITFSPDLAKFKMQALDNDIVALFSRRAYDVAASTRGVKVQLNGKRVPVKNFKDYVDLFLKDRVDDAGNPIKFTHEAVSDRWEVAVAASENGFQQISFVNSIATTKGGRHVDYVSDMVVKNLTETIKKKNKNGIEIKPFQVRNHLWLFVNCLIENPTFDSQTKENMTLQARLFGSKCQLPEAFYTKVAKSGIVENVLSWAKFKAESLLNKTSAGRKQNKVKGLPKLEDANDAGTKNSMECTLLLTEGDSAKTIVVAGLGVVGRDKYGVFPLRGKLLNVREASTKQIMENAEINALVKILGLQYKRKYRTIEDMKTLRYGKLMIMTDQDHDGSHIKGLIINFIHHNWPDLLKMNFMEEFITPIVKANKGDTSNSFFSIPEFEEWKKETPNWKTYHIKYYKGLGTSTSKEAKEYFTDIGRHRIKFRYEGQKDDENITMAFSKKCVDQRKDWLTSWMENTKQRAEMGIAEDIIYSKNVRSLTYSDFINKELVLFSNLDNERSIPSLVDGLKPGQRKVLFTCFKRNDKREVKVAQLAGSVGEQSAYHHGEASLMSTIINLAQNYVGSNNINLLQPIGQFGTRLMGGKDAASPRYIFTKLSPLARVIFNVHDDPILKPQFDDNQKIEPEWYCPIIPMVLVNGADGIGTGWMTKVPNFNPRDIIDNLERMIRGDEPEHMRPWYKGFRGEILEISSQKYVANGEISVLSEDKIEVTELPIGTWTQTYKENLIEPMATGTEKVTAVITDYKEYHTDVTVKFVIQMKPDTLSKFENQGFHKVFKLQTNLNLTSMVLFDKNGCLKKYESVSEILHEFFELRLKMYSKRKEFLLGCLTAEAAKLSNQARFILEKCDGKITVENKKKKVMVEELFRAKYDSDPVKAWKARVSQQLQMDEENVGEIEENGAAEEGKDYDYLLHLQILNLTLEKKEALLKERDNKLQELETLKKKTPADLYTDDLKTLRKMLNEVEREEEEANNIVKKKIITKKGFSRKAEIAAGPSPMGQRVEPRIDELLKKFEAADKAKENKGKGKGGRKKLDMKVEPEDEEDEFDKMVGKNDSLLDVLNSSGDAGEEKEKKPTAGTSKPKPAAAKADKAAKPAKSKGAGDGLKQTKLIFKKKESGEKKKKKKNPWDTSSGSESSEVELDDDSDSDSDFDGGKPAKKAAPVSRKPRAGSSDSESDFGGEVVRAPAKRAPASAARKPKVDNSDDDSDSDFGGGAATKKAPAAAASKPTATIGISDSEDEPLAAERKDFSFDDLQAKLAGNNQPEASEKKESKSKPVPVEQKKSKPYAASDSDDDPYMLSDDNLNPTPPPKKSAPAPATKKAAPAPKSKKEAAPKKKKVFSDSDGSGSDSDFKVEVKKSSKSKPAPKSKREGAAAPKKKPKKAVSSDEDELFDIDSEPDMKMDAEPARPRTQRAAAAAPKKWKVDDSDDDKFSDDSGRSFGSS